MEVLRLTCEGKIFGFMTIHALMNDNQGPRFESFQFIGRVFLKSQNLNESQIDIKC